MLTTEEAAIVGYQTKLSGIDYAIREIQRKIRIHEEQVERGRELGLSRHKRGRRKAKKK